MLERLLRDLRHALAADAESRWVLRGGLGLDLSTVGLDASRVPAKLKSLLAIRQWLKPFMKQSWAGAASMPLTAQALLETVWTQQVSQPTAFAAQNDRAASELAKAISQREELWLARGGLAHLEPAAAFNATVHSESWLRRLQRGPLQAAMLSTRAEATYGALVASLKHDRDGTLELIANLWGGRTEWAGLVIAVMRQLNDWTPIALDLVTEALAVDLDALETVDSFAWQLRPTAPAYAIELVARHLERRFSKQEPVLPQSPPLAEDAAEADRFRWYREREPRKIQSRRTSPRTPHLLCAHPCA